MPRQKASWTESITGVEHQSVAGELVVTLPEVVEEREMDGLFSFYRVPSKYPQYEEAVLLLVRPGMDEMNFSR